jgi:hypothetical protein
VTGVGRVVPVDESLCRWEWFFLLKHGKIRDGKGLLFPLPFKDYSLQNFAGPLGKAVPRRLKPLLVWKVYGTGEAVPFV